MISFSLPNTFLISYVFIHVKFSTRVLAAEVANSTKHTEVPPLNKYSYISPVGLKTLFALEVTLYNSLSQYADLKSSNITKQLQLYLADFEDSTLKFINNDEKSTENLSWNPILAFRTVWRFVKYLKPWAKPGVSMSKNQASKLKDISLLLGQHYNASDGPTPSDLEDAKMALVKLVDTFTLDIQHFASGNISGKDVGVGLTAAQCIEIGWFAIRHELYATGVEFMEAALYKVEHETGDVSVQLSKAREHVTAAYKRHDEDFHNTHEWDIDFFMKTLQEVSARTDRTRRRDVISSSHAETMYDEGYNQKYRFQGVCKGIYRQATNKTSKLFCWYEHQVDPTFKIGPLKAEFVAPQIVKFHRLISKSAISQLKSNTSIFRELHVKEGTERTVKDFTLRLGAFSGLHPRRSSTEGLIADLAGRATGLQYNDRNYEALHMSVYTPGAYFVCHPDHGKSNDRIYESRIATFMVYLSEVEQGGETGFCKHGVLVKPEVGSALFWFNMLSSSEPDLMSDHCSCPVVFGEKWVSTAWISMGLQSHIQCNPDQSKRLEYLVNKKASVL